MSDWRKIEIYTKNNQLVLYSSHQMDSDEIAGVIYGDDKCAEIAAQIVDSK